MVRIAPQQTAIGWIGTGVMGAPMCARLLDAGFRMTVFNRTRSRAEPLLERGTRWADSPSDLARGSEVVITMVGYPEDVRALYLGEGGILSALNPGSLVVDMTTSEPSLAVEIANQAEKRGITSLDAPVSGGDVGAREGSLSIMVGGSQAAFEAARPLFEVLGRRIRYMGSAGMGQHTKAANQTLVAATMVGTVESLLYGMRAGLNPHELLEVLKGGAAACWSLTHYGPRILKNDLDPGFKVEHFLKDMGIVLREAEQLNLPLPGLALCRELYVMTRALGYGNRGTQSLFEALARMAGRSRT